MTDHKHEFDANLLHAARCKCGRMQYSQTHAKELEVRAEAAETEVERLFKAAWEARELMNLNDPEYVILSKALEPKT